MTRAGATSRALHTEIITTTDRLVEVGPAWDALWLCGGRSVFQSHGWIAAWWGSRPAGDGARLCVGVCWAGNDLVAVLPFATRRHRGVRVLEWAAKECSDYCDALIDPERAEGDPALKQIWAAVAAAGGFDLAYLSHVRPDAALHGLLDRPTRAMQLRPGRRSAQSRQVRYHGLDSRIWFQGLDAAVQDSHVRGMRTLAETGPIRSEMHGHGDDAGGLIDRMIALKRRSLANAGQTYAILDNGAAALNALVNELARQQALQVFTLHCGDHLAAALVNIATGTRVQVFFAAHDPQFDHAAPEMLALIEYTKEALAAGTTEVDLLCVEAGSGYAFTNAQIDLASYVGAKTLAGRLALAVGERRA